MTSSVGEPPNTENLICCIADWDGTFRKGFMVRNWCAFISTELNIPDIFGCQFDKLLDHYHSKLLDYHTLVHKAETLYANFMKNMKHADIYTISEKFVAQDIDMLFSRIAETISLFNNNKIDVIIISGAPREPLLAYAKKLGIDRIYGLSLKISDEGIFLDTVLSNPGKKFQKEKIVKQINKEKKILFAFGDSEADEPLFCYAKHSYFIVNSNEGLDYFRKKTKLNKCDFIKENQIGDIVEKILKSCSDV